MGYHIHNGTGMRSVPEPGASAGKLSPSKETAALIKKEVILMKLLPASRRELKRIAAGTLVCDILLTAGLLVASRLGLGSFDLSRILLSMTAGSFIAVLNFALMCMTIQRAVTMTDRKRMKSSFHLSYSVRMLLQALWSLLAFLTPGLHAVAATAPLLFPKVTIVFLQSRSSLR